MNKQIIKILLLFIFFTFIGCLEDVNPPLFKGELNVAAKVLSYLESQGDFANSQQAPPLIDATELFNNLQNYLIIDTRSPQQFSEGHIENAVNISNDSLYDYIDNNANSNFSRIVLISRNGQSASYYCSLLRLAGFNNVYSLRYGMASWNIFFADDWLNATGNDPNILEYTNDDFPKNPLTDLPELKFSGASSISRFIKDRIKSILSAGFNLDEQYRKTLAIFFSDYTICYVTTSKFYYAPMIGPLGLLGHAESVVLYMANPIYDLRSSNFLQTLPTDKTIFIYGSDGHLSACIAAYLKVLGYQTSTLIYGSNQLFYSRMIEDPELKGFAFTQDKIMNYPYVSGK